MLWFATKRSNLLHSDLPCFAVLTVVNTLEDYSYLPLDTVKGTLTQCQEVSSPPDVTHVASMYSTVGEPYVYRRDLWPGFCLGGTYFCGAN